MKKQGVLIYDDVIGWMDIRFGPLDYYGGLHCGERLEVLLDGEWMPPFGNKKAPAFSHENRCVERCSALDVRSYHFPFLILPPIRMTENTATTITAEIHMGESTHIQLHLITPNSFSTIKTIVRTDTMPSPPCFALLSILFLKNLFHNFCKLRWRAVEKNAYTVNFSRQNADTDGRAD